MVELSLTSGDKAELIAFLKARDGAHIRVVVPTAFPQQGRPTMSRRSRTASD